VNDPAITGGSAATFPLSFIETGSVGHITVMKNLSEVSTGIGSQINFLSELSGSGHSIENAFVFSFALGV
jgi:hypothetical protein